MFFISSVDDSCDTSSVCSKSSEKSSNDGCENLQDGFYCFFVHGGRGLSLICYEPSEHIASDGH